MGEKEANNDERIWHVRVRPNFDDILDSFIDQDTHANKSEFIRQAVREKLERLGVNLGIVNKKRKT